MSIKIEITEKAIRWIEAEADRIGEGEDIIQTILNLCKISEIREATPALRIELVSPRLLGAARDLLEWRGVLQNIDPGLPFVFDRISSAINDPLPAPEQEASPLRDRLFDLVKKWKLSFEEKAVPIHYFEGVSDCTKQLEELLREGMAEGAEHERSSPEGEGIRDALYQTADSLMRYYAEEGADSFRARFGSLDILESCRKILSEGEGSPHPWPGEEIESDLCKHCGRPISRVKLGQWTHDYQSPRLNRCDRAEPEGERIREDRIRELARDLVKERNNISSIGDYARLLPIIGEIKQTLEEEEGEQGIE